MINKSKMSCCYYPTTTVFIDDSQFFLDNVLFALDKNINTHSFTNPVKAIDYLKNHTLDSFTSKYLRPFKDIKNFDWINYHNNTERSYVDIDLFNIHKNAYNPKRFETATVVAVDYTMPQMNGLELCRSLKDQPFKFILITGESTLDYAVTAFNEGLIHHFIPKGQSNFINKLENTIYELQNKLFEELSEVIIRNLIVSKFPCLNDPMIVKFIKDFFKANGIVEYYLVNEAGGFLLIDFKGNLSWLDIKNEEEMTENASAAMDNSANENIIVGLQSRRKNLVLYTDSDYINATAGNWEKYLYPATKIIGSNGNYYYSHIKKVIHDGISADKITSYQEFLQEK